MTQQEFETLTGLNVSASEFDYINRIYMATNFQKDKFCAEWKTSHKAIRTSDILCDMLMESENREATLNDTRKLYKAACDNAQRFNSDMADFLIEQYEVTGTTALREKAIKLIGKREYLRRKVEAGYVLTKEDRAALSEILA